MNSWDSTQTSFKRGLGCRLGRKIWNISELSVINVSQDKPLKEIRLVSCESIFSYSPIVSTFGHILLVMKSWFTRLSFQSFQRSTVCPIVCRLCRHFLRRDECLRIRVLIVMKCSLSAFRLSFMAFPQKLNVWIHSNDFHSFVSLQFTERLYENVVRREKRW